MSEASSGSTVTPRCRRVGGRKRASGGSEAASITDELKKLILFSPSAIALEYEEGSIVFYHEHSYSYTEFCSRIGGCLIISLILNINDVMGPLKSLGYTDPGWEHGIAQDEKKKKVKCNYCEKIVSGGIYRFKQHLARVAGEVKCCRKAPKEVILKIKDNLEAHRGSKKRRLVEDEEQMFDLHSVDDEEGVDIGYNSKIKRGISSNKGVDPGLTHVRSSGLVDPGWEHGVAQDDKKKKVKCNYCEKIVSGGINRFKQHLARIPGEVAYCKMAPEEVYLQMKENMKWHRTGWKRRAEVKGLIGFHANSDNEELPIDGNKLVESIGNENACSLQLTEKGERLRFPGDGDPGIQLKNNISDSSFPKAHKSHLTSNCKQPTVKTSYLNGHKEVLSAICKFFYYAAIPFDVVESSYFHRMLDLVSRHGQGLKAPAATQISGRFLQNEVAAIRDHITEVKASWSVTGCTVILDNWKDVHGRALLNILVSCTGGTFFISSIDASNIIENVTNLFIVLDGVIEDLGEENVVQIITENTDCFRAAGKLLQEKRRSIFWTPCAGYCMDQILEDFLKIKCVEECISKGQRITRLIYNHSWLLDLMRRDFTAGRDLLRPAATRFATSFITLQSLLGHRTSLKRMFQSSKWLSSQSSKSEEGNEVKKVVLNNAFWKKVQYIIKSVEPVLNIIKKVESGDGFSMPFIYNDIYRAKISIKSIHGDDEQKYSPFWNVMDSHWNTLFHHPLFVAAYFLNPSFRYRPDFMALPEVIRGLNECIARLEPDLRRRVSAVAQISDFVLAKADFGTELALSTRVEQDPAAWWQQHGVSCLELQRIAIRILSQTCSSFGSEHQWSALDHVHSQRQSHFSQRRFTDVAYVHYNLRLRERQMKRTSDNPIFLDNFLSETLLADWVVDANKTGFLEDEEFHHSEMEGGSHQNQEENDHHYYNVEGGKLHSNVLNDIAAGLELHAGAVADQGDTDLDFLDEHYSEQSRRFHV